MRQKISPYINRRSASIFVVVVLIAITTIHVAAQSGTGWFKFEAESGSASGQVQTTADALASNGSALRFTAQTTGINLPNPGSWSSVTNSGLPGGCVNAQAIAQVPGTDKTIVGIGGSGLFVTSNGGASWTKLGTGAGSASINTTPSTIVFDPTNSDIFWVAGIYGDAPYKTTDGGNTFVRLGNIGHLDDISIDFSDPQRRTILAGVHERTRDSQGVLKSSDGGQTWSDISSGISTTGFTSHPLVINSMTYLETSAEFYGGNSHGIFRTTNGGATWTQVSTENAQSPFKVAPDGTIYVIANDGLAKSTNQGQTWTHVGSGFGLQNNRSLTILPDGRLVAIGSNRLLVSADGGVTWTPFGANLPFGWNWRLAYSPPRNAFFLVTWDCGTLPLPNGVQRLQ